MAGRERIKKQKPIKPDLPGGFRDYGPADAIARQRMIDTIRRTFESFGFDPLETSSVQRTEVLTGGEEDSGRIIFNVMGSQEKNSDTSLRFDLTVPLARFIAANPDLSKPFKRYQIGNVWRGERQQAGRWREFTQADVDIVGSSSIDADAEIATIIYTVFKNLGIGNFVINYNNRKMLDTLPAFAGFPKDKLWSALRIIDKKDKIGEDGIFKELIKVFTLTIANKVLEFLAQPFEMPSKTLLQGEGLREYAEIKNVIPDERFFQLNRYLVRGLSYYTGSVFEVTLTDAPEIGSVCGGGRYDDLVAKFTGQKIPAVGASIGVDRLFAAIEKLGALQKKQTLTQVLVLQLDVELKNEYLSMVQELRNAGINTAFYLGGDQTLQAQLAYAVKKEIPYVAIYGAQEKKKGTVGIKDLAARRQQEIPRRELATFFKTAFPPVA
ncbi:MAG: histidine--tRNA ligase [Candidatus Sungbacteria bacterium]|uniref:Histidine--tRNA ligase n=1 Tax=Candidatus Sungiibacteriota bacterium TaxID=2750080 RepID=A0A932R1M5_9BACT|nr:histidine--tRNA ligase [Candidatus Sungbacteria bacterium]